MTTQERAAWLRLEARSYANTCEDLARAERVEWPHGSPIADALEQAARLLRELTKGAA